MKKTNSFKVMIAYPPLPSDKGVPLLSQNRQFQWFHNPTYIYPVVPAYAATMLKNAGCSVVWADGIAQELSEDEYLNLITREKPDLIAMETKTPVIKRHWQFINYLKEQKKFKDIKIVLMGDHVTALPKESMENCQVDFIICGGDYDFALLNLVDHLSKRKKLEKGVWYRAGKRVKNTGPFQVKHSLDELPVIDRQLTKWQLYAYKNGNYKYTPGAYTMIGRDCWWRKNGGCAFCAWTTLFPTFRVAPVALMIKEVENLISLGVREIFDDTGTFPIGRWLYQFCDQMIEKGYNKKVVISCNMRAKGLTKEDYQLLAKAGFRFLLYGLESASQKTLDMIGKGITPADMITAAQWAKEAGLDPHVTCMVGYPWETLAQAQKTVARTRELFDKGYIDTLQATIIIPYPGTRLFKMCEKNGWLQTKDWDRYDMREPIMTSPIPAAQIHKLTQDIYKSFVTPRFILRKIISIRSWDDIKFLARGAKYVLAHLRDFMFHKTRSLRT